MRGERDGVALLGLERPVGLTSAVPHLTDAMLQEARWVARGLTVCVASGKAKLTATARP